FLKPTDMKSNILAAASLLFISFFSQAQTDQELIWGSYYGVENAAMESDWIKDISEFNTGSFAIFGQTHSTSGLSTINAHQTIGMGSYDCFLAYFNADRQRLWGTYFGGPNTDIPSGGIVYLSDGSLVIAGTTTSDSNIASTGSFMENIDEGSQNGFITRFSDNGELLWSTYLGSGDTLSQTE